MPPCLPRAWPRLASRSSRRRFCSKNGRGSQAVQTTTISPGSRVFTAKCSAQGRGMGPQEFRGSKSPRAPGGFLNQPGHGRGQRTQGRVQSTPSAAFRCRCSALRECRRRCVCVAPTTITPAANILKQHSKGFPAEKSACSPCRPVCPMTLKFSGQFGAKSYRRH